jgi:hypothetical protein
MERVRDLAGAAVASRVSGAPVARWVVLARVDRLIGFMAASLVLNVLDAGWATGWPRGRHQAVERDG